MDAAEIVGTLVMGDSTGSGSPRSYVLTGSNTLTLNNSGSGATITLSNSGSNVIETPVILNDAKGLTVDTVNGGGNLAFGSNSTISGTGPLTMSGAGGTLILSPTGADTYSGGTDILAGTLVITSTAALPAQGSLTIAPGGTFIFDPAWPTAGPLVARGAAVGGPTAVPEPGTWALLAAALLSAAACGAPALRVGLVSIRKRKR